MKKIVLAGGSGFLGRALAEHFVASGCEVVVLTRAPKQNQPGVRSVLWDGQTLDRWGNELEGAEAVVNLCGRSVNCRYHARNRRDILSSRIDPTRALGRAMARCLSPPRVWLNSSTATIYQHTFGPPWDESGAVGETPSVHDEFSVEVARAWEAAVNDTCVPGTRKIALRTAMVLGHDQNSVFPVLRRLTKFGLGGRMGTGEQYVSWIHQKDFCRAVQWLIESCQLEGPVNVCAPSPIPNREMMRLFQEMAGVPFGLPASAWMLAIGALFLRTETELILKSRRVIPQRLLQSGFEFRFATMRDALADLTDSKRTRR